jgi:hypothetical protein
LERVKDQEKRREQGTRSDIGSERVKSDTRMLKTSYSFFNKRAYEGKERNNANCKIMECVGSVLKSLGRSMGFELRINGDKFSRKLNH